MHFWAPAAPGALWATRLAWLGGVDHCILQHLVDPSALDHFILQHLVDPSALDHCILQHLVDPSLRASHLLLRLSLSVGDPLRWFVGVDVRFTSCSGGRGVSTVGLSSSGSFHCTKSIELFQIWSSPGPAGRLMSSKLDFGGLPKPIQFLICSLYRLLTFWLPTVPGALWEAFRPGCDV